MGYEIAGGLGVKMARPGARGRRDGRRRQLPDAELRDRDLGDARAASSSIVVLDNRGYGCIQPPAAGVAAARRFNNLLDDCVGRGGTRAIDFAAHARAPRRRGRARRPTSPSSRPRCARARAATRTQVVVIDTDAARARPTTAAAGGRSRCPRSRRAPRCRARARAVRSARRGRATLIEQGHDMTWNVRIGINPISWSNDDLPSLGGETPLETALRRRQGDRLRGLRARQQVPARAEGAGGDARAARPRLRLRLVLGRLARDGTRRRRDRGGAAPHLDAARAERRDGDGLRRGRRQRSRGDRTPLCAAAAVVPRRRSGAPTASG